MKASVHRIAILLLAGVSAVAQPPPNSIEREAALGKQLAAEFRDRTVSIDSPTVLNYVTDLARKIAAYLPDVKFPLTFSVIAGDECDAVHEPAVLPGGYLFVPAGLFLAAQSEDEFAGMLTHVMEHVAQRDETRMANNTAIGGVPLIFMTGWSGGCSSGLAIPQGFRASRRSAELEADVLAAGTMARAGFDPRALVHYVERIPVRPRGSVSAVFAPLPDRDTRLAALSAAVEKLPSVEYAAAPTDEFAAVRQEVRRLTEPPVRPDGAPSLLRKKLP
jgi:predicted Zn-dependent protease